MLGASTGCIIIEVKREVVLPAAKLNMLLPCSLANTIVCAGLNILTEPGISSLSSQPPNLIAGLSFCQTH